MPAYTILLAHDERPGPATEWPAQPGGPCDGWAEWFGTAPLLFRFLLGDALHPPEPVPFSAYQDRQSLSALAAPMDQVQTRWQWLKARMEPLPIHWPESVKKQWQEIDRTITTSPRQWLLLDCATLCPHDFDKPEFGAFLTAQRDLCLQWDCCADGLPDALQDLKQKPQSQLGWWNPSVIARTEVVEQQGTADWPAWLAEHYEVRHHCAWDEALDAYCVMPRRHPRTGKPPAGKEERDTWPVGLVTPYGRWLQRPIEGACMAFASGGHISVRYPESRPGEGAKSGLKDLNGVWAVPPGQGYLDAYALTPHVMLCKSPHAPHREDLRSLPGLELLHAAVYDVSFSQEQDALIRAFAGPDDAPCMLLLDPYGKPLFDGSRYERVGDFNARTGLAVASIREPCTDGNGEANSHVHEGVVHISGKEIIPCEYELIERGFSDSPPKVLPGGKLLAFTHEGQPRIYSTRGQLLAAPDIWCPPLNRDLKKNELLAFMGQGPEAELGMFSIQDFSFTRTGETWEDYRNALKGMFKGLNGETLETHTLTREELMAAEDGDWMQDMARMLCLGNEEEAAELVQQWRDCVADSAPGVMDPTGAGNALTLYWGHLVAIATQFARFDWKDADGIAATHWLPGTADWRWDTPADGVEAGLEHLGEHLAARGLALFKLATDDDSIRLAVVRAGDAAAFLERLAQAGINAWDCSSA